VKLVGRRLTMAGSYNGIAIPADGKKIGYAGGKYEVPENPVVPFIEGDGTGRDIWKASRRVFDAAVEKAYKGKRRVPRQSSTPGCPMRPLTRFVSFGLPSKVR
jgi:hypothetical protein